MMTGIGERSEVLKRTNDLCKGIASHSEILFKVTQDDPADSICSRLELAAASLDIKEPLSDSTDILYIRDASDRMRSVSDEIEHFRSELSDSLTELYKLKELLSTISSLTKQSCDMLSICESSLRSVSDADIPQSEKALISHSLRDITLSQAVAQKNISIAESWLIKTDSLISGLDSFENHLIPLWKAQYQNAGISCKADDMKQVFETGRLFTQKLSEIIRKVTE